MHGAAFFPRYSLAFILSLTLRPQALVGVSGEFARLWYDL